MIFTTRYDLIVTLTYLDALVRGEDDLVRG